MYRNRTTLPGVALAFLAGLWLSPAAPASADFAYHTTGTGWDGAGNTPTALGYYVISTPSGFPAAATEVTRALNLWAKYADITWQQAAGPDQSRTIDLGWFTGNTDGWGNEFNADLAHTRLPPLNSTWEPQAGDVHFNGDKVVGRLVDEQPDDNRCVFGGIARARPFAGVAAQRRSEVGDV